jgi:hypothetical protein
VVEALEPDPAPAAITIEACAAADLAAAQTAVDAGENDLGGGVDDYTYPKTDTTENGIFLEVIENKSPLLGGDGAVTLQIKNTTDEVLFNAHLEITLPVGHTYESVVQGRPSFLPNEPYFGGAIGSNDDTVTPIPSSIKTHINASGQKYQVLEWDNFLDLAPHQEHYLSITTQIENGTEYSDNPETLDIDESQKNIAIGDEYTGEIFLEYFDDPAGEDVAGSATLPYQTQIRGLRVDTNASYYHHHRLTGESSPFSQKIFLQNNPTISSGAIELVQNLPAEFVLTTDLSTLTPPPVFDRESRTLTWNIASLSTSSFTTPQALSVEGYIPYKQQYFTDNTGDVSSECEGEIIAHNTDFSGKIKATTSYSSAHETHYAQNKLRAKHLMLSKKIVNQPHTLLLSGDQTEYAFEIHTSDYYSASDVALTENLPNGFSLVLSTPEKTSSTLQASDDEVGEKFFYEISGTFPAGSKNENILDVTAKLDSQYKNSVDVVGVDYFTNTGEVTAKLVSENTTDDGAGNQIPEHEELGVSDSSWVQQKTEHALLDIKIAKDDGNGNPVLPYTNATDDLYFTTGEKVHYQLSYTGTQTMPSDNQFLTYPLPPELRFIENSDSYTNSGTFNQTVSNSTPWENAGNQTTVSYNDQKNTLSWYLGKTSPGATWKANFTVQVRDTEKVQNGQSRTSDLRLTGLVSSVKNLQMYTVFYPISLQYKNPTITTTKTVGTVPDAANNNESKNLELPENAKNLENNELVHYSITVKNTAPQTANPAIAYAVELKDILPENIHSLQNFSVQFINADGEEEVSHPKPSFEFSQTQEVDENNNPYTEKKLLSEKFTLEPQASMIFTYQGKFSDIAPEKKYKNTASAQYRNYEADIPAAVDQSAVDFDESVYGKSWKWTRNDGDSRTDSATISIPAAENNEENQNNEEDTGTETEGGNDEEEEEETGAMEETEEGGEGEGEENEGDGGSEETEMGNTGGSNEGEGSGGGNNDYLNDAHPNSHNYTGRYLIINDNSLPRTITNTAPVTLFIGYKGANYYRIKETKKSISGTIETEIWSDWYSIEDAKKNPENTRINPSNNQPEIIKDWLGLQNKWNDRSNGNYELMLEFKNRKKILNEQGEETGRIEEKVFTDTHTKFVVFDTAEPEIKKIEGENATDTSSVSYLLTDELSGLKSFSYSINGEEWKTIEIHNAVQDGVVNFPETTLKKEHTVTLNIPDNGSLHSTDSTNIGNQKIQEKVASGEEHLEIFYEIEDNAGNKKISGEITENIVAAEQKAEGFLQINNDAKYTSSRYVTLNGFIETAENSGILRDDIAQMRFKNVLEDEKGMLHDQGSWSSYYAFKKEHLWALPDFYGTKKVLAEYKTDSGEILTSFDVIIYAPEYGAEYVWTNDPYFDSARQPENVNSHNLYTPASTQIFAFDIKNTGYKTWQKQGENATKLTYTIKSAYTGNVIESEGDRAFFAENNPENIASPTVKGDETGDVEIAITLPLQESDEAIQNAENAATAKGETLNPDLKNIFIIEFDLVEGLGTFFSDKNVNTFSIPVKLSGERGDFVPLTAEELEGIGGIRGRYGVDIIRKWVKYDGKTEYGYDSHDFSVPAGKRFTHHYLLKNIKDPWWRTFKWEDDNVNGGRFDLQMTGVTLTEDVLSGSYYTLNSSSYAPNRPGQEIQGLWGLYNPYYRKLLGHNDSGVFINIIATENCSSHQKKACSNDDVYWYDSCGKREERYDNCSSSEICKVSGSSASCVDSSPQIYSIRNSNGTTPVSPDGLVKISGKNLKGSGTGSKSLKIDGNDIRSYDWGRWTDTSIEFYLRSSKLDSGSSHTAKIYNTEYKIASKGFTANTCRSRVQTTCSSNKIYYANSCGEKENYISSCSSTQECRTSGSLSSGTSSAACVSKTPSFSGLNTTSVVNGDTIKLNGNNLNAVPSSQRKIVIDGVPYSPTYWSDSYATINVPSTLSAGTYSIKFQSISTRRAFILQSDWCAQLNGRHTYDLTLKPGQTYQINPQFRNVCKNPWSKNTTIKPTNTSSNTSNTIRLSYAAKTGNEILGGQSYSFSTIIKAPTKEGNYSQTLYLQDGQNSSSNTKKTAHKIQVNVKVEIPEIYPEINICPTTAKFGENLVIKGENFAKNKTGESLTNGVVLIGGVEHSGEWIKEWTNDTIAVKVKSEVGEGYRPITVQLSNGLNTKDQGQNTCETLIQKSHPFITDAQPDPNTPGNILRIDGENFGKTVGVVFLRNKTNPSDYTRHSASTKNILTWTENTIELTLDRNLQLGDLTVDVRRNDGENSNKEPIHIDENENCFPETIYGNTPLYRSPYAERKGQILVIETAGTELTPIEWAIHPSDKEKPNPKKWLHVMYKNYQGWVDISALNQEACSLDTTKIPENTLQTMWDTVQRGGLEYVSALVEIPLVKYNGSFPPVYTHEGFVQEGERMYVLKLDGNPAGEMAKVMTDKGKVGWIDATYLNIDPSPYVGTMLFPLANSETEKTKATQEYGWTKYAMAGLYDGSKHKGIDLVPLAYTQETQVEITNPETGLPEKKTTKGCGAPVYSVQTGTVDLICRETTPDSSEHEDCKGNGNMVRLDHSNGLKTTYAHLSKISGDLTLNQSVTERTFLGRTGNTGKIFGDASVCHLDFGVWQDGESQNPYRYFKTEGRYLNEANGDDLGVGMYKPEPAPKPPLFECDHFSDIENDNWVCPYVITGLEEGLLDSKKEKFNPEKKITRAEFLKMVMEANGLGAENIVYTVNNIVVNNALTVYIEPSWNSLEIDSSAQIQKLEEVVDENNPGKKDIRVQIEFNGLEYRAVINKEDQWNLWNYKGVFKDTGGHWVDKYLNLAVEQKLINSSTTNPNFSPENPISLVEGLKMIYEMGSFPQKDELLPLLIPEMQDEWYKYYLSSAIADGVVNRENGESFKKASRKLQRDEALKIILEGKIKKGKGGTIEAPIEKECHTLIKGYRASEGRDYVLILPEKTSNKREINLDDNWESSFYTAFKKKTFDTCEEETSYLEAMDSFMKNPEKIDFPAVKKEIYKWDDTCNVWTIDLEEKTLLGRNLVGIYNPEKKKSYLFDKEGDMYKEFLEGPYYWYSTQNEEDKRDQYKHGPCYYAGMPNDDTDVILDDSIHRLSFENGIYIKNENLDPVVGATTATMTCGNYESSPVHINIGDEISRMKWGGLYKYSDHYACVQDAFLNIDDGGTYRAKYAEVKGANDYLEGMQDQLSLEGYNVLINAGALLGGAALSKSQILRSIADKIGTFAATKFGAKIGTRFIPYLGQALMAVDAVIIADEIKELHSACTSKTDSEGYAPEYYCGRRDILSMFIVGGLLTGPVTNNKVSSNYSGISEGAKTQKKRIQKIIKEENLDNALVPLNETLKNMNKTSRNNFLEGIGKLDDGKVKNLLDDNDKFIKAGGDPNIIKLNKGNDSIWIKNFIRNPEVSDNVREFSVNNNTFRKIDLENFSGEIKIKTINDLPVGQKLYRVSPNDLGGDGKTYWTLEKPKKEIIWEKEWAINRIEWHKIEPNEYKIYELEITPEFKNDNENITFLQGKTASQEPWMQMPGGKDQLLFEYNKLPENTIKKIQIDGFVN